MICFSENNAEVLLGYFEGMLSEPERIEVQAHIAECSSCRELVALRDTLDDYSAPDVSLGFDGQLHARIATEDRKRRWWTLWAPIAATAALVIGIFFVQTPAPVTPDKQVSVDQDIQQLEQALEDLELLKPLNTI
jgi:anti-sigma factor RsiW